MGDANLVGLGLYAEADEVAGVNLRPPPGAHHVPRRSRRISIESDRGSNVSSRWRIERELALPPELKEEGNC